MTLMLENCSGNCRWTSRRERRMLGNQRLRRDGYRCVYCGLHFLEDVTALLSVTFDHFQPKSAGGGRGENLVACCRFCNELKGERLFASLGEARAYITRRRQMLAESLGWIRANVRLG